MIDLHNHILPGVDDGASDIEESLAIARQFVHEGVSRIAATPHLDPERSNGAGGPAVRQMVEELRSALHLAEAPLILETGNELYVTPGVLSMLDSGDACTLGGSRAVLLEVSLVAAVKPLYLDDVLFRLQTAGYVPVLAHPERYAWIEREPAAANELSNRGIVLQLTAPSLSGYYGRRIQKTALELLQHGDYRIAASDRHHPGDDRSLATLHERIQTLADHALADLLLIQNPGRLLNDQPLQAAEPFQIEHRTLFDRWFHRS